MTNTTNTIVATEFVFADAKKADKIRHIADLLEKAGSEVEKVDFLRNEADKIDARNAKKSSAEKKPNAEVAARREELLAYLADGGKKGKDIAEHFGWSSARVSGTVKPFIADGTVIKSYDKKDVVYTLA